MAWHGLGWEALGFSEIETFPSAVLKQHYPLVTNFGDMTNFKDWDIKDAIDLIVGGTPCQSFSIAGLRKGLDDERGNLMLVYVRMLEHFKPKWFVWENVPGVLSSNGGKDFGTFLGALAELGYGFAYRVLDAKNFGVPQRRRRVFVVGYLGDWRPPAQVLFECESVHGNIKASGESGQDITAYVEASFGTYRGDAVAGTLKASGGALQGGSETLLSYGIPGNWIGRKPENGGNATEPMHNVAPCLTNTDKHAVAYRKLSLTTYKADESASTVCSRDHKSVTDIVVYEHHPTDSRVKDMGPTCSTVTARWGTGGGNTPLVAHTAVVYDMKQRHNPQESRDVQLTTENCSKIRGDSPIVHQHVVRRLTPVECERLQGFPDNYTNIPWRKSQESPDSLRYKALGNSMAVPVMRWIGERICMTTERINNANTIHGQ